MQFWSIIIASSIVAAALIAIFLLTRESMFGCLHEFKVVQNFGQLARRIGCPKCRRSWYVHDAMDKVEEWGDRHVSLYRDRFGFTIAPWEGDE